MTLSQKKRARLQGLLHNFLHTQLSSRSFGAKIRRFCRDPKVLERIEKHIMSVWDDRNSPNLLENKDTRNSSTGIKISSIPTILSGAQKSGLNPLSSPCLTPDPSPNTKQTHVSISSPLYQSIPAPASPSSKPMSPSHPILNFRITNGMVAKEYRSKIELVSMTQPRYAIKSLDLPENLGLSFNPTLCEISGIPTSDGQFKIVVWYVIEDADIANKSEVSLVINPDPKSLWKDIPSKTDDPYWKTDMDSLLVQGDNLSLVAASKRGRSHAHVGGFRDDDFHLSYMDDGKWNIAIVSDGAGSAKFSRRGSEIICEEGGKKLQELLANEVGANLIQAVEALEEAKVSDLPKNILERRIKNDLYTTLGYTAHHVTKLIHEECKARADLGGVLKDYSSTAIIGLCRRFSFGVFCAAYWVGDGAVAVLCNNQNPILLGEADSGEYSGQTRFLDPGEVTQEALFRRINFVIVDDFKAFVLMTDGVSDPFFETEANLSNPEKWSSLWKNVETQAGLLQRDQSVSDKLSTWMDFWSPGNHDDRTIAAIY